MLIMSMNDLREYRLRYNVSASAIAKKMGKSRQYINQIEIENKTNTSPPNEDTKKAYLKALYEIVQARQEK